MGWVGVECLLVFGGFFFFLHPISHKNNKSYPLSRKDKGQKIFLPETRSAFEQESENVLGKKTHKDHTR